MERAPDVSFFFKALTMFKICGYQRNFNTQTQKNVKKWNCQEMQNKGAWNKSVGMNFNINVMHLIIIMFIQKKGDSVLNKVLRKNV